MILDLSSSSQVRLQEMAIPKMTATKLLLDRSRPLPCPIETVNRLACLLAGVLSRKAIASLAISKGIALTSGSQVEGIRTQACLPLRQETSRPVA